MQGELMCLLDDLEMLSGDFSKDQKFLAEQFVIADENGDGQISFEEFKVRVISLEFHFHHE